ncbi:unnamed protein product, partial [Prorocentrum cordatum]
LWAVKPDISQPAEDWQLQHLDANGPCDPSLLSKDLPIYTDGSDLHPAFPDIGRSGVAVVQLSDTGELYRAIRSPLPCSYKQAPVHAEHAGLAIAAVWSTHPRSQPIYVDCATLLKGLKPHIALKGSFQFSDYWKVIAAQLPSDSWLDVRKIKAHRELSEAVDEQDATHITANRAADWHAKEAAKLHDLPPEEVEQYSALVTTYTELLIGVGKILGGWPQAGDLYGELNRECPERAPRKFLSQHSPIWDNGRFRCTICLRRVSPNTKKPCQEVASHIQAAIETAGELRHKLQIGWVIGSRMPIVFCAACGGFTSSVRSRKLHAKCTAKVSSELRKLRRGEVPGTQPLQRFKNVMPV